MQDFTIARNAKTGLYEIHATGCAHLISKKFDSTSTTTAASGADAAAAFEAANEDCYTKLGPCAKAARVDAPVEPPAPCGYCRRCLLHDDPGGCLEVARWERENPEAAAQAIARYWADGARAYEAVEAALYERALAIREEGL
jgi:hypothetical protein